MSWKQCSSWISKLHYNGRLCKAQYKEHSNKVFSQRVSKEDKHLTRGTYEPVMNYQFIIQLSFMPVVSSSRFVVSKKTSIYHFCIDPFKHFNAVSAIFSNPD